jgi:hypothetical protein
LTRWLGLFFMLPLLIGFIVDWWQVSGRYDPVSPANAAWRQRGSAVLEFPMLPVLRLLLMVAVLSLPVAAALRWPVMAIFAVAIGVGCLTRLCSIALLGMLVWLGGSGSVDALTLFCVAAAVALLLFGGGRLSLWRADDALLRRAHTQ